MLLGTLMVLQSSQGIEGIIADHTFKDLLFFRKLLSSFNQIEPRYSSVREDVPFQPACLPPVAFETILVF